MPESSALIESLRRVVAIGSHASTAILVEAWRESGLPAGQLHDLYAIDAEDAASAAGFAVACALMAGTGPLFWIRTAGAERQGGRLHGAGFAELGLDPALVTLACVADEGALLKAAADAARCAGLGMIVIESWGRAPALDLTATRRLMLAAEAAGTCVVSLRIAANPGPSAAATRWGIAAAPSRSLAANAPGGPAFAVELLRRRGGPAGGRWLVEWNRDAKVFTDLAPLSGARLPLAPDRAVAGNARAPVRWAG